MTTAIAWISLEEEDMMRVENETRVVALPTIALQTKSNFDNVTENTKPESRNSGSLQKSLDSTHESGRNEDLNTLILPDVPNLYKHIGVPVENLGYFIIPKSVYFDPRFQGARLKYQKVLIAILANAAFAPTTHAIGCEVIQIAIGQFCVSELHLVELCNEGVKFKEDKIDKNIVHRAVQFWARCQFVNQQVIHGKNLLTITIPEYYDRSKKRSEPASEPKVNQNRTTKEEDKEDKEDNISSKKEGTFVPSEFATALLTEFYSSLFSSIPDFPKDSARKTKTQYQAADRIGKKANGDMDLIRKVIAYSHQPGGFWLAHVHSVTYLDSKFTKLVQQLRDQGKKPMNGQAPVKSKHNNPDFKPKVQTPMAYNNKISFNTEKK